MVGATWTASIQRAATFVPVVTTMCWTQTSIPAQVTEYYLPLVQTTDCRGQNTRETSQKLFDVMKIVYSIKTCLIAIYAF